MQTARAKSSLMNLFKYLNFRGFPLLHVPWGGSAESISDPGRSKRTTGDAMLLQPLGNYIEMDNEGIPDVSPV